MTLQQVGAMRLWEIGMRLGHDMVEGDDDSTETRRIMRERAAKVVAKRKKV